IAAAVKSEEKVALIGFGTFSVNTRAAHQGVNPATGAAITIPEKKVVKFKAGADLAI
ncbi:MAG: HU family DNA-binding protein, partial [Paraprevotella sp.]|nr:HU family DNA-binding protein [Paraprevotella sp.]